MAKRWAITFADENQFTLAKGAVSALRASLFDSWKSAAPGDEREFYEGGMDRCDALLARFEAALIADTSQDAEPEEGDDED